MNDVLLSLGRNQAARKVIKRLGLPIPLPESLRRAEGPWPEEILAGKSMVLGHAAGSLWSESLRGILEADGAKVLSGGEASSSESVDGLVFDASGIARASDLVKVYEFFHSRVLSIRPSGRMVILGVDPNLTKGDYSPEASAAQSALTGFAKSLAKESGKRGTTVQVIYGADREGEMERLAPVLRFFLSERAAFISGQGVTLTDKVSLPPALPLTTPLNGRTALVTGAARGIGRAIALRLAEEGAHVIGVDRPEEREALARTAELTGGQAVHKDLLAPDAADFLKDTVGDLGLDILVNNAGMTRDKTLARMKRKAWEQVLDLNLAQAIAFTEALLPLMRKDGRVIYLSSISGIAGNAGQTNYAAAKAGLIGYVHARADSLASRGITMNAVAPGFIETPMTAAIPLAIREVARRFNALSQGGIPADVAEGVTFLASPGAFPLTGSVLRICGLNLIGT